MTRLDRQTRTRQLARKMDQLNAARSDARSDFAHRQQAESQVRDTYQKWWNTKNG